METESKLNCCNLIKCYEELPSLKVLTMLIKHKTIMSKWCKWYFRWVQLDYYSNSIFNVWNFTPACGQVMEQKWKWQTKIENDV